MTDVALGGARPKLGIGKIIGETFSVFFRHIGHIALLSLLPSLLIVLVSYMLLPEGAAEYNLFEGLDPVTNPPPPYSFVNNMASTIFSLAVMAIVSALIVRLAYDAKSGRPMRTAIYVSSAVNNLIPLVVCSVGASLAIGGGLGLFILPGLYLAAMWCAMTPAIVIEGAGYKSFGHSRALTKNYRWPCMGVLIVIGISTMIPSMMFIALIGFPINSGPVVYVLTSIVSSIISFGLFGVATALLYARLREIRDGTSVDELADIFA